MPIAVSPIAGPSTSPFGGPSAFGSGSPSDKVQIDGSSAGQTSTDQVDAANAFASFVSNYMSTTDQAISAPPSDGKQIAAELLAGSSIGSTSAKKKGGVFGADDAATMDAAALNALNAMQTSAANPLVMPVVAGTTINAAGEATDPTGVGAIGPASGQLPQLVTGLAASTPKEGKSGSEKVQAAGTSSPSASVPSPVPTPFETLLTAANTGGAETKGTLKEGIAGKSEISMAPSAGTAKAPDLSAAALAAATEALAPGLANGSSVSSSAQSVVDGNRASANAETDSLITATADHSTRQLASNAHADRLQAQGKEDAMKASEIVEAKDAGNTPDMADADMGGAQIQSGSPKSTAPAPHIAKSLGVETATIAIPHLAAVINDHAAKGERSFEIRLDPPELGKVDVRLHINKDGEIRAHLAVERSDTLDMMLRDSKTLERAIEQSGMKLDTNSGLSFTLRQDGGNGSGQAWRSYQDVFGEARASNEYASDESQMDQQTVSAVYGRSTRPGGLDLRV